MIKPTTKPKTTTNLKRRRNKTITTTKAQKQPKLKLKRHMRKCHRRSRTLILRHSWITISATYRKETAHLLVKEDLKIEPTASSRNPTSNPSKTKNKL